MALQQENMIKFMTEFTQSQETKHEQEHCLHRERMQAECEREEQEKTRHAERMKLKEKQEAHKQEEARAQAGADKWRERLRAIQLPPPMSPKTDLLEYLKLFKRTANRKEIPQEDWSPTIIPLFKVRFRGTATKLPPDTRDQYDNLKIAFLERDDSNIKNAASMFWTMPKKRGTTALEYYQQILQLIDRFTEGEDHAGWMDLLAKEWLIQELPKEGRIYIRQRKPKNRLEATALAEEYFHNQEDSFSTWSSECTSQLSHNQYDTYRRDRYSYRRWRRDSSPRQTRRDSSPWSEDSNKQEQELKASTQDTKNPPRTGGNKSQQSGKGKGGQGGIKCFECGRQGHKKAECPSKVNRIKAIT